METVDLVTVTTETITGYAFITETLPVATPSTTFRTISVKKYARPSTVSSVQTTEASQTAYAFSILSTSSEEESTSTTTFVPFTSSLSSSITSTQIVQSSTDSSSSITSESASVLPTPSTQIHILKTTTSSLPSSSSSSTQNEPAIQTTSSTQLPILLPTKTQTLITLPTTSIPKFTPSPPPAPSEEQFPARKPLTITFTTLGSISLVLLLVSYFLWRRRKRQAPKVPRKGDGRVSRRRRTIYELFTNAPRVPQKGNGRFSRRRRTIYELFTNANVHEKDGVSVGFRKSGFGVRFESLRGASLRGSLRRGRERIYELQSESGKREDVDWMMLKDRVRVRMGERLGGLEGRYHGAEKNGRKSENVGRSVRWADG